MFPDEFLDRYRSRIHKTTSCWEWTGSKDKCGYGVIKLWQRNLKAHRVAYEIATGVNPEGSCVLHRCDSPACVNPDHLFLGTPGDNARDRSKKGRTGDIRGEKNGRAKLSVEQVAEIRRLYQETGISKVKLGKKFGVSDTQIGFIVRNKEWRQ